MLKLKLHNLLVCISFISFFTSFQMMSMSVEDKVAKIVAGEIIRNERTAQKKSGGYSHAVYNNNFGESTRTTGKFKAFGLTHALDEQAAFLNLVDKNSKIMIVEFHPGLDIFGNEIDPVQMSCSSADCKDAKCAIDLKKVSYCVFMKLHK